MIRFAVPPIGGQEWFGGWMYMRNLARALAHHGDGRIETCVFVGPDRADDVYIAELRKLPHTKVVVDLAFDAEFRNVGTLRTLATGRRGALIEVFRRERIDVVLDWATYYGWRCEIPTLAWIPDFQHRALPHQFGRLAWYRREAGFRLQIAASTKILLSSAAAERDCQVYYPASRAKTHVARFAVPVDDWPKPADAEAMLRAAGMPRDFVFLPNQIWHHKNHALAIDAASILARRGSRRTIVATGHGLDPRRPYYRAELVSRIRECKAERNFIMLDGVDHELVKAMMTTTNALLNPSRFEGWSTTVEEAKAIGTPMLLSDISVHREQAPSARFFDIEDAEELADAILCAPVRDNAAIKLAAAKAAPMNLQNQRHFAQALSDAVQGAAHAGRGVRAA
jgi:glycosyltransferase involved in cell wall biosynthesis